MCRSAFGGSVSRRGTSFATAPALVIALSSISCTVTSATHDLSSASSSSPHESTHELIHELSHDLTHGAASSHGPFSHGPT